MLDIQFIRDNAELVRYAADRRGIALDLGPLFTADDERRKVATSLQAKKARVRLLEKLQQQGDAAAPSMLQQLAQEITAEESHYGEALQAFKKAMLTVPNIPDISVPTGTETETRVLVASTEYTQKKDTRNEEDILASCGYTYVVRGETRVPQCKSRSLYLLQLLQQGILARLTTAQCDVIAVPSGVLRDACIASGMAAPDVPTLDAHAFVGGSTMPYAFEHYSFRDVTESVLPERHAVTVPLDRDTVRSQCVGMMTLCAPRHDISVEQHEAMRAFHESLLQSLGIPYTVEVLTARHAAPEVVKSYVLSVTYGETPLQLTTISYYHDFQARRAGLTTTDATGKKRFLHTVCSDGFALKTLLGAVIAIHGEAAETTLQAFATPA